MSAAAAGIAARAVSISKQIKRRIFPPSDDELFVTLNRFSLPYRQSSEQGKSAYVALCPDPERLRPETLAGDARLLGGGHGRTLEASRRPSASTARTAQARARRSAAAGSPSSSRYFATVRRDTCTPPLDSRRVIWSSLSG